MKRPSRVAIVGRPNVGKSTLFNRITRKRRALVHPTPGVTRDVQRIETEWTGVAFELIDTGGLFSGIADELVHEVEKRAWQEALGSDVMIFVTDAETGITGPDIDVANRLREIEAPVFLVVNKSEKNRHSEAEFFELGFERIHAISALHGQGVGDLLDEVVAELPRRGPSSNHEDVKLAIVGRPNVGKSSLINAMLGKETTIVDSRPGTTRDSVDVTMRWFSKQVTLVDTAGIRRQSRSKDGLTSLSALKSIDAISRADVVVMVVDASRDIANQDMKVTSYAHRAGKGLIFCVNKWDLVADKDNSTVPQFEKKVRRAFKFASYAPVLFTSAVTGQRVSRILEIVWRVKEARETRLPTSEVNRFLEEVIERNPPPSYGGGNGKIYYVTQVDVSPPTFSCFVNKRAYFGRAYVRFLNNRLRDRYSFEGTVIRIKLVDKQ
ncbi:MAG: ribosome biogenesis GTPase Der [Candidatus Krumholzibacteriia bacterium]